MQRIEIDKFINRYPLVMLCTIDDNNNKNGQHSEARVMEKVRLLCTSYMNIIYWILNPAKSL